MTPVKPAIALSLTALTVPALAFGEPSTDVPSAVSVVISATDAPLSAPPPGWDDVAVSSELLAPVFDTYERPRHVVGQVQRGSVLPVRTVDTDITCHDNGEPGRWYEIPGRGYVCTASGYEIGEVTADLEPSQRLPDLSGAMPFRFVKVIKDGSIRYDAPKRSNDEVAEHQTLAYFLAVADEVEANGEPWIRTVYNEYVPKAETKRITPTKLVGEALGQGTTLPLAFVRGPAEGVPLYCAKGGAMKACGHAEKYTRFSPKARITSASGEYVETPDGRFAPAEHVRVIRKTPRPKGVPKGAKWVHIDLDEQAFVAYEGDRPVYTSLISSGLETHATPTGLYRVQRKYVTKTMRGPDPDAGRYRVEEIPWVMYYYGNYALHGAYWHDEFGGVRSHGCTNIAPPDAKWLFEWGTGEVPTGWLSNLKVDGGTWFYFTREG